MQLLQSAANWVWETTVAASVLILIALVVGALLRKPHFTPIRHLLGLLIVARLLLPLSLPSPFSVFNFLKRSEPSPALVASGSVRDGALGAARPTSDLLFTAPTQRKIPALPIIWALVALTVFARIFRQHLKVSRWTRDANLVASGSAFDALQAAKEASLCQREIKLYSVPTLSTPALFGLFRPAILLPSNLAASASASQLRLICLHEIAHLRRFDVLINWLMIFAQALHWFNPLVWFAMRRLRAEQELLCDADVMRILRPDEHRSYGETLLALASPSSHALSTLIPISSNFKQLKERIAMIKQFNPATRRILLFTLPPLAAILALLTFTAATEKKPEAPAAAAAAKDNAGPSESERRAENLNILKKYFQEQDVRVAHKAKELDDLRKTLGIVGDPSSSESVSTLEVESIRALWSEVSRLELKILEREQTLGSLRNLSPFQAIYNSAPDPSLTRLVDALQTQQRELVVMEKQFAEGHPTVKAAQAGLKSLSGQIEERYKGMLNSLEAGLEADRMARAQLRDRLEAYQNSHNQTVERSRPYFAARRDLDLLQKNRDALFMRILEEQIDAKVHH